MAWVTLILAGIFEVVGVIGINLVAKHNKIQSYMVLILGFLVSFSLLSIALSTLPMGIAYAVWTGIGTAGGTLVGMFVYGDAKDWKRILFIALIITAIVGLKLSS
ncbi:QacE family quaternary ammonium compound efflux SMR transporter [Anoxybacillus kestanbolensis]|uniref:QacE family quaternary ammonium compound efflux SMR transporter n=1 Tax=Anoxybacillus kestanbolensis TaxID=227476 RepID=A0A1V3FGY0_9BACL|nr:multidrug efflux SMR transporter [Anoxybacillus kestanbolensis]OOE00909.1 QacE family quaternary ammonium compound efflux SMR transporter [Anoxybacillus kestanbolensis]